MPSSFGDVIGEYRAITGAAAVVTGAHDVVWVEGRDAVRFLQGIISQDVEALGEWSVARSFFLSPQGKLRALLWVAKAPERVALIVDAGRGETLAEDLEYYRIRVKAAIHLEERPIWEVWGPDALSTTGVGPDWEVRDDGAAIPMPMRGLDRVLLIGGTRPGLPRAGRLAVTAVRVEYGEPVFGVDVDEATIPQETGLTDESVSFDKGCYLGQELVARIDSRGHVNRHLRSLAVTRNVLPPEGAPVYEGERQVGVMTSVSESLASPVGLVLLRREVEVGAEVEIRWDGGSVPAVVRSAPLQPASG